MKMKMLVTVKTVCLVICCGAVSISDGLRSSSSSSNLDGEKPPNEKQKSDDADDVDAANIQNPSVQLEDSDPVLDDVARVSQEEQQLGMLIAERDCLLSKVQLDAELNSSVSSSSSSSANSSDEVGHCPAEWDGIACWPRTVPGRLATQPCPRYINHFRLRGVASRRCEKSGHWFVHEDTNATWSNYTLCAPHPQQPQQPAPPPLLALHVPYIRIIYNTGYGLSLVILLLAVTVMLCFKKLRCPRNTLHLNLFASFIIRATMALTRDLLLTEGVGLAKDMRVLDTGQRSFDDSSTHWECRLLIALFNYALTANYAWIFVEGLYLHTLLFLAVFSESSSVLGYIVFGWVSPLVCVVLWVIVRATTENDLCWNTHPTPGLFWIIKGPVLVTIVLNFCFFINIVRVLFTKLQAFNSPDSRKYRHRKLVKSALVLIPLFGVPYIVFLGWQENIDEVIEVVKLYFEMTFNSFNGVIVAMLYCFLNGEVQSEIGKKWASCRLSSAGRHRRNSSASRRATMTSNIYASRCGGGARSSFRSANSTVITDKDENMSYHSSEAQHFKAVLNNHGYHGNCLENVESVPLKRLDNGGCDHIQSASFEADAAETDGRGKNATAAVVLDL